MHDTVMGLEVLRKEPGITSWLCRSEAAPFASMALCCGMGAQKSVLCRSSALVETSKEVQFVSSLLQQRAGQKGEQEGDI